MCAKSVKLAMTLREFVSCYFFVGISEGIEFQWTSASGQNMFARTWFDLIKLEEISHVWLVLLSLPVYTDLPLCAHDQTKIHDLVMTPMVWLELRDRSKTLFGMVLGKKTWVVRMDKDPKTLRYHGVEYSSVDFEVLLKVDSDLVDLVQDKKKKTVNLYSCFI